MTLYHPPDVAECSKAWSATCGPCSLAAALGRPVASIFDAVSDPPDGLPGINPTTFRGWMTIGQMKQAVVRAGAHLDREWPGASILMLGDLLSKPAFAGAMLVCIQWHGPWPPRAAAKHRHWIALRWAEVDGEPARLYAYDWNAKHRVNQRTFDGASEHVEGARWSEELVVRAGGWLEWMHWESVLLPLLIPERGDGTWRVQWAGAVRP
jgi:hypothetical protein